MTIKVKQISEAQDVPVKYVIKENGTYITVGRVEYIVRKQLGNDPLNLNNPLRIGTK